MGREKESKTAKVLEESCHAVATVLDNLDALVYVSDMRSHKLLYINEHGRRIWGEIEGETCWKVLHAEQEAPCEFCTNDYLLDEEGEPTGVYVWEFQNPLNGHWYQCRDQAIRWVDGSLVRMAVATDISDRKKAEEALRVAKKHAENLALKDSLTGLDNRRAFFDYGHRAFLQARRYAHPLSVIMMDVDHFKKINDNYGHWVGDQVLQALAEPLQTLVRGIDIVARTGGEEFAFILPETGLDEAARLAERLRAAVENIQVAVKDLDKVIRITASLGVAACGKSDENLEEVLTRADDALYVAKKKGRNQVKVGG